MGSIVSGDDQIVIAKLDRLSAEVQEVRGLTIEVAITNERLAHIIENQEAHRQDLEEVRRDVYGPQGLMTRVAVNGAKVIGLVSLVSAVLTVLFNFGLRLLAAG